MHPLPLEAKQRVWATQKPPYEPHTEQLAAHASEAVIKVVVGGERAGKSTFAAQEVLPYLFLPWSTLGLPDGLHCYLIGPTYKEPRAEFEVLAKALHGWKLVAEEHVPPSLNQQWVLRTAHNPPNWLYTWSGKDAASIRSFLAHLIVLCEAGKCTYDVRLRAEGRLSDSRGLLLMSGTFEGSLGWLPQEYQQGQIPNDLGIQSYSIPSWGNLAAFPGGRTDPAILRLQAIYPRNVFDERVAAIPSPPTGIVFPEARWKLHVAPTPYTPGIPVALAIDPGFSNPYAVVPIQEHDGVLHLIEGEVYLTQRRTTEIIQICQARPWWKDVTGGTIDIASTQNRPDQITREDEWDLWLRFAGLTLNKHYTKVDIGIETLRSFLAVHPELGRPRLQLDHGNLGILSELGLAPPPDGVPNSGPWVYIKNSDGTPTDKPEDRNNHATKALAYHLVTKYGAVRAVEHRHHTLQRSYSRSYEAAEAWR